MTLFLAGLGLVAAGGLSAFLPGLSRRAESRLFTAFCLAGCGLGAAAAARVLAGGPVPSLESPWPIPAGGFALAVDPLSALFLLLHFTVSGASVLFGLSYFKSYEKERSLKALHVFFSGIILFVAMTFAARQAVLFLFSWEAMAVSAFFLVAFEHRKAQARKAAYLYLLMTRLGTLCLFAMFSLLAARAGSFDFSRMAGSDALSPAGAAVFFLALVGFGVKAGIMPLHVWLPEAHPAAPSPVSALFSGVMIKTGVYGLVRVLSFFPRPPAWWGGVLIAAGIVSGVGGVAWALAQQDFKRFLAYSSIENIGIIVLSLGVGCLGAAEGRPLIAALGFAGGLAHAVNHGLFKSLLFLGAGSVYHATGTVEMDRQGGLWKRMPWTGLAVLAGSMAICGLPPFNGFIGEWLAYSGSFRLAWESRNAVALLAAPALALTGALALASFAKAFGAQFLGAARSEPAARAHESDGFMRAAMLGLAAACLLTGLFPAAVFPALLRAADVVFPGASEIAGATTPLLGKVGRAALGLAALAAGLAWLRLLLLKGKPVAAASTWGCGYAFPTSRMQYTASSFAQLPASLFRSLLRPETDAREPAGYFPEKARFESRTPDAVLDRFLPRAGAAGRRVLEAVRRVQHGQLHYYLAYGMAFLLALLLWNWSL